MVQAIKIINQQLECFDVVRNNGIGKYIFKMAAVHEYQRNCCLGIQLKISSGGAHCVYNAAGTDAFAVIVILFFTLQGILCFADD